VAIYVEVGLIAVPALANMIGQPADRQDVACPIERQSIVGIKPLRREDPLGYRLEAGIVGLKRMRVRHHP
jgi:hypothetical protein